MDEETEKHFERYWRAAHAMQSGVAMENGHLNAESGHRAQTFEGGG